MTPFRDHIFNGRIHYRHSQSIELTRRSFFICPDRIISQSMYFFASLFPHSGILTQAIYVRRTNAITIFNQRQFRQSMALIKARPRQKLYQRRHTIHIC